MPFFPNIPALPGVPPLPRLPGVAGVVVDLLLGDLLSLIGGFGGPQWGLFIDGAPAVTAESVVSFEYKKGYRISNFPVEEGKFESYNKVEQPYDVRIRFSTGGDITDRQELLDSAAAAVASLELMDAVTPEAVYESLNPVHYDYRRTAVNGVGLLIVDIFCEEVRSTASSSFTNAQQGTGASVQGLTTADTTTEISVRPAASISNPQSPSAALQVSGGTVQPLTPSTAQQSVITNYIAGGSPF